MNETHIKIGRISAAASAVYDGVLGALFLFAPAALFEAFSVTPPNHFGYVQFPAMILILFAIMFVQMACKPESLKLLLPYGAGLKLSYIAITGYHWISTNVPVIWKPFVIIDLLFLICFAYVLMGLRAEREAT